ncbi:MAG: glycerate kinase [Micropruina sp.]
MAERRPRVLLACGAVAELSPRAAAQSLARGFAESAEVAAVGLADGGRALGQALVEPAGELESLRAGWLARRPGLLAVGADPELPPDPLSGSSAALGCLVGYALQSDRSLPAGGAVRGEAARNERTTSVVIDLSVLDVHDAGAGLLGALGATADVPLDAGPQPLAEIGRLDLDAAQAWFAGCDLVGLVSPGELGDELLGLRGITSRRGRALGTAAERMLAVDAALERFAGLAGAGHTRAAGAGAAGGAGFAVLALGGRLSTGAAFCAERVGLDRGLAAADLVVTACDSFDFGTRGGGVVTELARRCEAAETPLLVVSPTIEMSEREMRVMGVESGHWLEPGSDTGAALTATGRRLVAGWSARW